MGVFIEKFGIDWRLLAAQAVNFFILFFLLAKFVYRPVISLLEKRRKRIEEGLTFTTEAERRIADIEIEKTSIIGQAQRESVSIIEQGIIRGKQKENEITIIAERHADQIIQSAHEKGEYDQTVMRQELYGESKELLRTALGRILTQDAFSTEQDRIIASAIKKASQ